MLVVILVVSLFLSAFFSAAETAFTSLEEIQLRRIKKTHPFVGKIAVFLHSRLDTFIGAILIGNNIANVVFSVAATKYTLVVFGDAYIAVMTGCVVLLMLLFGEITPKQLALKYNSAFVLFSSPALVVLFCIFYPFAILFSSISVLFHRSKKPSSFSETIESHIYHEHLRDLLLKMRKNKATRGASRVRRALSLSETTVGNIMTHRKDVKSFSLDTRISAAFTHLADHYHRNLPLYAHENKEEIVGVVHVRDILQAKSRNQGSKSLESLLAQEASVASFVSLPVSLPVAKALPFFQEKESAFAIVIDEFGGLAGVVTLTDIARYILNPDLFGSEAASAALRENSTYSSAHIRPLRRTPRPATRKRHGKSKVPIYSVSAEAPLSEIEELSNTHIDPRPESHTIGGYLVEYTGGAFLNEDRDVRSLEIVHPSLGTFAIAKKKDGRILSLYWTPMASTTEE